MTRRFPALMLTAGLASVLGAGCIVKDTSNTMYLAPDGAITWTILERDVRSDSKDPNEARTEEDGFMAKARAWAHPAAAAMRLLTPDKLDSKILRETRPFAVMTTGHFASIDWAFRRLAASLRLPSYSTLENRGSTMRWTLTIGPAPEWQDDGPEGDDVGALFDSPLRIMLEHGTFVRAEGFLLVDGDMVATIDVKTDADQVLKSGGQLKFLLEWTR